MSGVVASQVQRKLLLGLTTLSLLASACANAPPAASAADPAADANAALVRRIGDDVWNAKKFEAIPEIYSADYASYTNGVRDSLSGPGGVETGIKAILAEYPDAKVTTEEVVANADHAATRWTFTGTNAATGKTVKIEGISIGRIADGKLVENHATYDLLAPSLASGATLTPPPAPPKK